MVKITKKRFLYNSSGKQKAKGNYKDGLKNGLWIYYNENGKASEKIEIQGPRASDGRRMCMQVDIIWFCLGIRVPKWNQYG